MVLPALPVFSVLKVGTLQKSGLVLVMVGRTGTSLHLKVSLVFSVVLLMPALRVFVAQKPVYRSKSLFALAQIVLRCSQPLPLISQCCVKVNTQNMGKV